jgi:hypothetical protein
MSRKWKHHINRPQARQVMQYVALGILTVVAVVAVVIAWKGDPNQPFDISPIAAWAKNR